MAGWNNDGHCRQKNELKKGYINFSQGHRRAITCFSSFIYMWLYIRKYYCMIPKKVSKNVGRHPEISKRAPQ